jgi:RimJ/RimL family protein N-acetyltransferase
MGGGGGFRRLLTDRLDLRSVAIGDQEDLHRILSDPSNLTYIPAEPLQSSGATQAWIERYMSRWDVNGLSYWTIRLRSSGAVIGAGGAERRQEFWNLYYLLDVSHRGRGYGTELARAAQRAAAALDPDLPPVAWIHEKNIASQAVARHLGLRDFGLLETDHWKGAPMHYWADRELVPPSDLPGQWIDRAECTPWSGCSDPAAPGRCSSAARVLPAPGDGASARPGPHAFLPGL